MKTLKQNQNGSVLIASLWAVSIFSVFLSSVAFQSGQQAMLLKRETQNFESRTDYLSAVHYFARLVLEDAEPESDSPLDKWYGKVKLPEPWDKKITLEVSDEEARIDLNMAPQELLRGLFEAVTEKTGELKGDAEDFADEVLKLRDEGRLLSIEELFLGEDIEKSDLEVLRPYITVSTGFGGINVNTADPLVLSVFIHSLPGDDFAKEELIRRILDYRASGETGDAPGVFSSLELEPDFFMQKLKLSTSVPNVQVVNQLILYIKADTRTWRLAMTSSSGRTARTVIREKVSGANFEVLSWQEY